MPTVVLNPPTGAATKQPIQPGFHFGSAAVAACWIKGGFRPGKHSRPVSAMGLAIGETETTAHGGHLRGETAGLLANR